MKGLLRLAIKFRVEKRKGNSCACGKNAATTGANATALIRLVVGRVYLSEGLLKFLYPVAQAAGRLAKIGPPHPDFFGAFVAATETLCQG